MSGDIGTMGSHDLALVVNRLQDVVPRLGMPMAMDLPHIVVVGEHNVGKFALLESFVEHPFLPRGNVIRCPLVMQLIASSNEYGEFSHRSGRFPNFEGFREEIEKEMNRLATENATVVGISPVPLHIRLYSTKVPNLTLVVLLSIPSASFESDSRTASGISSLITEFISKPSNLILVVIHGNTNVSGNAALAMAKEVDPKGSRTVGVFAGLHTMDDETNGTFLNSTVDYLKPGLIDTVICETCSVQSLIDAKATFTTKHDCLLKHSKCRAVKHIWSTKSLLRILNIWLSEQIRNTLLSLKDTLHKQLVSAQKDAEEQKHIGTAIMLQLIQQLQQDIDRSIEGSGKHCDLISTHELSGGVRVGRIFHERFPSEIAREVHDEKELRKEAAYAIHNARAVRGGIFTPDIAFDTIVKKQIERMQNPSFMCVELVVEELSSVVRSCTSRVLAKYPLLQDEVDHILWNYIRHCESDCKKQIAILFECELAYMNTKHEDFVDLGNAQPHVENGSKGNGELKSQVVREGWLGLGNGRVVSGRSRHYWFVLTARALSWFQDEQEQGKKCTVPLDNLAVGDVANSFIRRRSEIVLSSPGKTTIYKNLKQLRLSSESSEEINSWKASLLDAGAHSSEVQISQEHDSELMKPQDLELEHQVKTLCKMVHSYMKIVSKTVRDQIPKAMMHIVINQTRKFVMGELLEHLCACSDQTMMMQRCGDDEMLPEKRQDVLDSYRANREALRILDEASIPPTSDTVMNWSIATGRGASQLAAPACRSPAIPPRPGHR